MKQHSSPREMDSTLAVKKKAALFLAIAVIVGAAAGICVFVTTHARGPAIAKPWEHSEHAKHEQIHVNGEVHSQAQMQHDAIKHEGQQRQSLEEARSADRRRVENITEKQVQNATHQNSTHQVLGHEDKNADHDHKTCKGHSRAACVCILTCEVFGKRPDLCGGKNHSRKKELVDNLIQKSMRDHRDMCDGMRCIKRCAEQLGCLDEKVRQDCRLVEEHYEAHRRLPEPECNIGCTN